MEELIKLVSKKTGIPEAQAKTAVETVMDFLKERLPDPWGDQLVGMLSNEQSADTAENLLKGLGGLLGGKK